MVPYLEMKYLKIPNFLIDRDLIAIVAIVGVWRVILFFIASIADRILSYQPSFPYAFTLLPQFQVARNIYSFANFDGVHYLTLAREGYFTTNFTQAFFPIFPYLIRLPSQWAPSIFNPLLLGLWIANLSFLGAMVLLFYWVKSMFGRATAYRTILAVILFPSSIFFASVYTESLFLLLVTGTFFAASKNKWALASIFTLIAGATRIVGIFLVPSLIMELWVQRGYGSLTIPKLRQFISLERETLVMITLSSAGLLAYMGFLHHFFKDGLYFLHVQSEFGAGRSEHLVVYPQVVYRSLKILLTSPVNLKYLAYVQEFVAGTVGLLTLILIRSKISLGLLFFSLCCFFLPTLSGTFSSMLRYLLVLPPLFIAIALGFKKLKQLEIPAWILLGLLSLLNTVLFLQGYWVA